MCRAPVGEGANRTRTSRSLRASGHAVAPASGVQPWERHYSAAAMLIGAHVSNAGGLPKAVERGVERECDAIQIFNQSPRAWRPTAYTDEDFAAFREAREGTRIASVLVHAVYLINSATDDGDLREKS